MPSMRIEDGPSLPLASYVRGNEELQALLVVFDIHHNLLLAVLRRHRDVAVE